MTDTLIQSPVAPHVVTPGIAPGLAARPSSLLRHSAWFGVLSASVYAFSFVKTVVITHLFGTSAAMDAYTIAVVLPNLIGGLVAGSAGAGLVPILALAERSSLEERARAFRSLLRIACVVGAVCSILVAVLAGPLVRLVGFALDPQRMGLAVTLLRIVAAMLLFNTLYAVASAELLGRRRYAITAAAPVISTLVALPLILLYGSRGVAVLAYALVAGTAVQALVVLVPAVRMNPVPTRGPLWSPMVARALRDQLPLLLASGIGVLNVLVDQAIAGLLPAGAISGLSYGYSLNGIIAQCVVMSLGWVALPEFASLYASGEMSRLVERARECIRGVVLVAAPLTVLVIAAGYTAVKLTFQHGAFNASSTHLVYQTWAGYTVGLVPFAVGMMGVRMPNAIHEQRSLAKIAALMLPFNAGLDYLFMRQWGVFGISLSTSLVYCLTTWLILKLLRRRTGVSLMDAPTKAVLRRTFSLTALAGLVFVPVHYLHAHSALAVVTTTAANVALVLLLYRHARLLPITAAPVVRNV